MKHQPNSSLRSRGLFAALGLALSSLTVSAQLINVQFGQGLSPISPAYTGEGVITGGTYWNELSYQNNGFSGVTLNDDSGNSTNVTLSTNSISAYDQQNVSSGASEDALLQNYIYRSAYTPTPTPAQQAGTEITLTLNGLADNIAYNVVVYNGGNPTDYSLSGGTAQAVTGVGYDPTATFMPGITYAELTGISSDSGVLTLTTSLTDSNSEADISALQIEVAPEPSAYAMMAVSLGLLIFLGRFVENRSV